MFESVPCQANLWPQADYSYVVCQADAAYDCQYAMLVPTQPQLPVQLCAHALGVFSNCAQFTTNSAFLYQVGLPH